MSFVAFLSTIQPSRLYEVRPNSQRNLLTIRLFKDKNLILFFIPLLFCRRRHRRRDDHHCCYCHCHLAIQPHFLSVSPSFFSFYFSLALVLPYSLLSSLFPCTCHLMSFNDILFLHPELISIIFISLAFRLFFTSMALLLLLPILFSFFFLSFLFFIFSCFCFCCCCCCLLLLLVVVGFLFIFSHSFFFDFQLLADVSRCQCCIFLAHNAG